MKKDQKELTVTEAIHQLALIYELPLPSDFVEGINHYDDECFSWPAASAVGKDIIKCWSYAANLVKVTADSSYLHSPVWGCWLEQSLVYAHG